LFGLGRAQAILDGPKSNGELVSHTLVLGLDRTILLFRALDDGRQVVTEQLQASVEVKFAGVSTSHDCGVFASADGHFELTLDDDLARGDRRELQVQAVQRGLSARIDLSRSFPPGRIDMGDLLLRPLPLVASGRVVNPKGRTIEGITVMAWT